MSEALYAIKFFEKYGDDVYGPSTNFKYNSPSFGTPGKWHVVNKDKIIRCCFCGFHVPILESLKWWGKEYNFIINNRVVAYIVQLGGDSHIEDDIEGNIDCSKIACRRIRLIRELKDFKFKAEELRVFEKRI